MGGLAPLPDPVDGAEAAAAIAASGLTLRDDRFTITGSADATKTFRVECDAATTGTQLTLAVGAQTASRQLSVPVLSGDRTLAVIDQAQTFSAGQTFSSTVTIGGAAQTFVDAGANVTSNVQINGTGAEASIAGARFVANANGPRWFLGKSRGATVGSFSVVSSGDSLGSIHFCGADGTQFQNAATIRCEVDGTPGAADMPGRLLFLVSPDGGATPVEALRISATKAITFSGSLVAGINSGSTINLDLTDTAVSRTVALFRVNTSATAHTTAALFDVISSASTASDKMVRVRSNSVDRWTMNADGSASASGVWSFTNTTASTSTTTGAQTIAGGLGVAGAIVAGGQIRTQGAGGNSILTEDTSVADGSRPFGVFLSSGGVTSIGNANRSGTGTTSTVARISIAATGEVSVTSTTTSTSTTTGAVTVAGGLGVGGPTFLASAATVTGTAPVVTIGDTAGTVNSILRMNAGASAAGTAILRMGTGTREWEIKAGPTGTSYALTFDYVGTDAPMSGILTVSKAGSLSVLATNAVTNNQSDVLILDHASSGTPTTAFGTALRMRASSDTTAAQAQGSIITEWATATHASRKARLSLFANDTAAREGLRIEASGTAAMIGFLGAAAVARSSLAAATGTVTRTTFDTATVTLPQLAERVAAIIADLRAYGLEG